MTTDEFAGHLLAALHGPHADEIVGRIVEVLGAQITSSDGQALAQAVDQAFGISAMFGQLMQLTIATLATAHAERMTNRARRGPDGAKELLAAVAARQSALSVLRETSRECLKTHAAEAFNQLPPDMRAAFEDT